MEGEGLGERAREGGVFGEEGGMMAIQTCGADFVNSIS